MQKLSDIPNEVSVAVKADTRAFDAALKVATNSTKDFGKTFTSTIKNAIISGKGFEDTLRNIALRLSNMALNKAFAPIENSISNLLGGLLGGAAGATSVGALTSILPFAKGSAFSPNGMISSPTLFGFGAGSSGQTGLMGEAGPEAILPLSRGADGKLGVATSGSGSKPVNVVFNVNANDAVSFQKSEAQITAMLARAVNRGQRNF